MLLMVEGENILVKDDLVFQANENNDHAICKIFIFLFTLQMKLLVHH